MLGLKSLQPIVIHPTIDETRTNCIQIAINWFHVKKYDKDDGEKPATLQSPGKQPSWKKGGKIEPAEKKKCKYLKNHALYIKNALDINETA